MKRAIVASLLLCGLILMGGAIRPDRDPGFGDQMEIGFRGGDAGWDTVVAIFTTQARTAIAGTDTFSLPASSGANDNARIYELNDYVLGRHRKSWRADNADTAIVYHMGTATSAAGFKANITSFAYTEIDSGRAEWGPQAKDATGVAVAMVSDRRTLFESVAALQLRANWRGVDADTTRNFGFPHFELVYIPFESVIPANATIVSATVNVSTNGSMYQGHNDSLICTLMTNPNDNKWYLSKGWDANHTELARGTWRRQRGASWGGVTNAFPWSPELNVRRNMWDWGNVSDWTGSVVTGGTPIAQYANVPIQATNCVQAAVTGSVNNGLLLSYHSQDTSREKFTHYNWDRVGNASVNNRTPYVVVKYITKKYQPPFGNKEWAFLFATDDGKVLANTSYDSVMNLHNGKMTMFVADRILNSATYMTSAQVMSMWASGNEIGNHSSRHVPAAGTGGGLLHYHKTGLNGGGNLAVGAATTGWDSLMIDCSPAWMYTMATAQGYGDLSGDRSFAKSHALPNGGWSPEIFEALYRNGYTAIRGTGANPASDRVHYWEGGPSAPSAPIGKARADSMWLDGPLTQSGRWARNFSLMAVTIPASGVSGQTIFGLKSAPAADQAGLDAVSNNVRRLAYQMIGQNRRAIITFTHALKSNPAAPAGYNDGVNADELDAALDAVDAFAGGGRYMGFAEYKDWLKTYATGIATPAFATAPDTFQVQATEKIWCIPQGVDNRWIRGVR
jgi:hypothetical protein